MALVAAVSAALFAPARARAEVPSLAAPPYAARADPWRTLAYQPTVQPTRLRLAIEEGAILGAAITGYTLRKAPPSPAPGAPPWDKIRFAPGTWYFDTDAFPTNNIAHPVAGAFYYTFARANRVSIAEASLWTLGAATAWELIEYHEPASVNDVWMTATSGIALGEAFTQLSAHFDRAGDDPLSQTLAFLLAPIKKLHDWSDGAVPARDPATRGRHEFQVQVAGGVVNQGGPDQGAWRIGGSTSLVRVPGWGEPGNGGAGFADGKASEIAVSGTFGGGKALDFRFDTRTALAGWYARDLRRDAGELAGWDLLAGLTAGFEFTIHQWGLSGAADDDRMSLARFPGVDVVGRVFAGPLELTASADVALSFGGVEPLRRPPTPPAGFTYPLVQLASGYYHALGVYAAPGLEARLGPVAAGAEARLDRLFLDFKGPFIPAPAGEVTGLADGRTVASAWLRGRLGRPRLELAVRGEWRDRWSSASGVRFAHGTERVLLASLAALF